MAEIAKGLMTVNESMMSEKLAELEKKIEKLEK